MEPRLDACRRSRWSCGLRLARSGPLQFRDLGGWDLTLTVIAPAGDQSRDSSGKQAQDRHPPDMPDEGEADYDRKESHDKPHGAVARHLYGLIGSFHRAFAAPL